MHQCAYHKLLANAVLVKTCHDIDKELKVGCEVAGTPYYPLTSSPDDYEKMMEEERKDSRYTDVMVKGHFPYYFVKEMKEYQIELKKKT